MTLHEQAEQECDGCRLNWRFMSGDSWQHREPLPIICRAQQIRIKLGRTLAPGNR